MRKQTKLVAVLSAAALLALGASMTSFAAGWEKDEAGIWHYYDSSDDMVTGEWKKDGGKWFYLDDDGDMLTDSWVDDEYYVGSDGAMYVNQWFKGFADDEGQDDPDDEGEHWYYFGSRGKKVESQKKKIGGKTYFFNEDGQMYWGWHQDDGDVYYLGGEDEGWRAENQWLWLEKPSVAHDEANDEGFNEADGLGCSEEDNCDDEGWYWFQSSGKMYKGNKKKKINGNFFVFNDHGQMLYEWINSSKVKMGSNAQLDGKLTTEGTATIGQMLWYRENGSDSIDGSRPTGWFKIDGSEDVGTDSDTDWYYIKKGEAKHADTTKDQTGIWEDGADGRSYKYWKREKIDGKWFAFNQKGQMQDGLLWIGDADTGKGNTYFFNSDGYQQTGKQSNVEEGDDETYTYYFTTKNGGNGKGITGEKDGYLYWNGKRLEADDDYRLYFVDGSYYLVNNKGKLQKSNTKNYDVELGDGSTLEKVKFSIGKNSYKVAGVTSIDGKDASYAIGGEWFNENTCIPTIVIEDTRLVPQGSNLLNVSEEALDDDFLSKKTVDAYSRQFEDAEEEGADDEEGWE